MIIKRLLIFAIFLNLTTNYSECSTNYKIIATINNEALTNYDLIQEKKIINLLNNYSKINNDQFEKIAINNLIEDAIKKNEIKKLEIKAEKKILNKFYNNYLKEIKIKNIEIDDNIKKLIFEKIKIGIEWKVLISKLYRNKINININEINKKINDLEKKDNNLNKEKMLENLKIVEINKKLNVYDKYHLIKIKKNYLIKIF